MSRKLAGIRSFFVFTVRYSPVLLSLETEADKEFRRAEAIGARVGVDGVVARDDVRTTVQDVRPVQTDGHVRERKTQT